MSNGNGDVTLSENACLAGTELYAISDTATTTTTKTTKMYLEILNVRYVFLFVPFLTSLS